MDSLEFCMYSIMSSAHNDSFTSSFPIWMLSFMSSPYPIFVARTSSIMLNKSGERGHPCLVPDLKGNTFSFSPFSMMLAVGLSYMAFIMLVYDSSVSTIAESFYHKWVLDLIKSFFCIY